MIRPLSTYLGVCFVLVLASSGTRTFGQLDPELYDFARPSLTWYTIESDHFLVHFHGETEESAASRTAQVVARVAEEVYEPITSLYGHEPDTRVSIILKDYEDYSNGAAYFFDNKIEIWVPSLDSPLRGVSNWLRNVITHEFTHIIQVQAAMKGSRRWPIGYLQWLRYEDVRRPDVLYGYPSGIVSYPIPVLSNPAWLAEGTAQYQRAGLDYDRWDAHRDMLLRMRMLSGDPFALDQLGSFFNKTSIEREEVYNHGFAFSLYLAHRFGEAVLPAITSQLSRATVWKVDRAIGNATGVPGRQVYQEFMDELRGSYQASADALGPNLRDGTVLHDGGFFNLFPRVSPSGSHIAFVSNAREDYSRFGLYVLERETGSVTALPVDAISVEDHGAVCSAGGPLRRGVGGGIGWRPDGKAIVYARLSDLDDGARLSDLYEVDLETGRSSRLTHRARASAPVYHPSGDSLAYVAERDGTTNLFVLDRTDGSVEQVTRLENGAQVSDPVWDPEGNWLYFGYQEAFGRDIYRIRADGTGMEPVVDGPGDERSPTFGPAGELYYASDASGIFNIYRVPAPVAAGAPAAAGSTAGLPVTHVLGGAFFPAPAPDGGLVFARFDFGGYRIVELRSIVETDALEAHSNAYAYTSPNFLAKPAGISAQAPWSDLNRFDDMDVAPLPRNAPSSGVPDTLFLDRPGGSPGEASVAATVRPYRGEFTDFTFLPVVRLDMYARPRRLGDLQASVEGFQGGRIWRNLKLGLYGGSREVLEGLSIFGGALIGPGSREHESLSDALAPANLLRLERDLFLQFEYKKGFGVIPKRWSPQVSVEMYNIRRNVGKGLTIEEFPCTSCYPDTTFADVAYTLWEADIFLRSKVSRILMMEAGYRYSPYRVRTEPFYSREYKQTIPASSSRYFIGNAWSVSSVLDARHPRRHSDVAYQGLKAFATYEYQPGRLLEAFEIRDGALLPSYRSYRNHRLTADLRLGLAIGPSGVQTLGFRIRGSTIFGSAVDDFFDDYVGGLTGARGYPFYALGGNETLWLQASYVFPILPDINRQVGFAYLTKLHGRIYADAAAAWSGGGLALGDFRKDAGLELRLGLGSFYLFPTAVFASATYGFDRFDFLLDEGFLAPDGRDRVSYGGEVQFHFGVLFNFDL